MNPNKIRVFLVDDSPTVRMILKDLLGACPDIEIAGEASNGLDAVERVGLFNPDIVVMDVQMPVLNGFEATEQIMAHSPKPILILSSIVNRTEVFTSMRAIELGALDVMEKPEFADEKKVEEFAAKLLEKIRILSRIQVITHIRGRHAARGKEAERVEPSPPVKPEIPVFPAGPIDIVAIGASTGGPLALKILLSGLSPSFDTPIVIVQHITNGFMDGMAGWLHSECKRRIIVAGDRQSLERGCVYFVPNGAQPSFAARGILVLDRAMNARGGFKPSADVLFESVAAYYGPRSLGILLTGMGEDGARGLLKLRTEKGMTVAQDRFSSIVYGMPRAAAELGAAVHILPIHQVAEFMNNLNRKNNP
ncbi:MAG: chemotaxis-specific protein-glutamate methyltransferase CheB [Acidobacteria bacterium]|nr:chemotaxis-specific protein-glutamate methyltransferase CheB [Acidobacteriota bacterium]